MGQNRSIRCELLKNATSISGLTQQKHPEIAEYKYFLGMMWQARGENTPSKTMQYKEKAKRYYKKAFDMAKDFFDEDHPVCLRYQEKLESLEKPLFEEKEDKGSNKFTMNTCNGTGEIEHKPQFLDENVAGDGACVFHAVALGFKKLNINAGLSHQNLRNQTVAYIRKNSSSYSEKIKNQIEDFLREHHDAQELCRDFNDSFPGIRNPLRRQLIAILKGEVSMADYIKDEKCVNDYIAHICEPTAWGGEVELGVLAKLFKIQIIVYKAPNETTPCIDIREFKKHTIYLLHTGDHYMLRVPKSSLTSKKND